jgi:hypothetical protein
MLHHQYYIHKVVYHLILQKLLSLLYLYKYKVKLLMLYQ